MDTHKQPIKACEGRPEIASRQVLYEAIAQ